MLLLEKLGRLRKYLEGGVDALGSNQTLAPKVIMS
jgi:hypothetical protein